MSCVDEVLTAVRSDFERAYFVTGKFSRSIYAEDCSFEDPTIKFCGRDRYLQNLELLVPFFDCPSIVLTKIEKIVRHVESRDVSALEAIGQIFTTGSRKDNK
ncbi:hypothetical protein QJS10_CPA06g01559 [Acorus calamus]|uniref:Uncharacterized protein n=1 Tax=Acorus calamus TaxID=4465 RepID=A0AAV9EL02_ACOCL|nr:hypothetical protein QJS10_CPA06g01559 [Acorus calamus]